MLPLPSNFPIHPPLKLARRRSNAKLRMDGPAVSSGPSPSVAPSHSPPLAPVAGRAHVRMQAMHGNGQLEIPLSAGGHRAIWLPPQACWSRPDTLQICEGAALGDFSRIKHLTLTTKTCYLHSLIHFCAYVALADLTLADFSLISIFKFLSMLHRGAWRLNIDWCVAGPVAEWPFVEWLFIKSR